MGSIIGVVTLELYLPEARTLKEKRSVVKGLTERLRERHNLSVAETEQLDAPSRATIAAACVGNELSYVQRVLSYAEQTVLRERRVVLEHTSTEII